MRGIGITVAVVGVVGLLASRLTRNYVVDALVAQRDDRRAASNAWDILSELMRSSFRLMVAVGILFLVAAWLAGPGRRALAARGWLAPALHNRVWAYVVLVVLGLLLLFDSSVVDFTRALTVAILMALGVAWIEITRGQTLREYPGRIRARRSSPTRASGSPGGGRASRQREARLRLRLRPQRLRPA